MDASCRSPDQRIEALVGATCYPDRAADTILMPLTPGARLRSYEIMASLGSGGMGEV
jgi:hypothetical protein